MLQGNSYVNQFFEWILMVDTIEDLVQPSNESFTVLLPGIFVSH